MLLFKSDFFLKLKMKQKISYIKRKERAILWEKRDIEDKKKYIFSLKCDIEEKKESIMKEVLIECQIKKIIEKLLINSNNDILLTFEILSFLKNKTRQLPKSKFLSNTGFGSKLCQIKT